MIRYALTLLMLFTSFDVAAQGNNPVRRRMTAQDVITALGYNPLFGPSDFSPTPGATEFQTANTAITARGGGDITVKPGTYNLAGNVYSNATTLWRFQAGAKLTGAGQLDAIADRTVLGSSGLTFARLLAGSAASHILSIQGRAAALSGATASTESTGLLISLVNNRPSEYSASRAHDIVNLELQQVIEAGVTTARAQGISVGIGPGPGADGYVVPIEGTVLNYSGIPSGTLGENNSKIAFHAVGFGDADITAAFVMSGNASGTNGFFRDGIIAPQESFPTGAHVLSIRPRSVPGALKTRADDVAWIGRDGTGQFASLGVSPGGQVVFQSKLTSTVAAAFLAGLLMDGPGNAYLFWDGALNRLVYAYNGTRLWSVDTSGNMRAAGAITGSTTP